MKDKPGDAAVKEFVQRLKEYSDSDGFDLNKFPNTLPRRFPLKLRQVVVGSAVIDWRKLFTHIVAASVSLAKPPEVSDEDHERNIRELWDAASPEVQDMVSVPFWSMLFYMFQHLPAKIRDALMSLAAEGMHITIVKSAVQTGRKIPSPTRTANDLARRERKAILARLPKPPRGGGRTKPAWRNPATLIHYAEIVGSRKLLAQIIKKTYERADRADDWREDLELDSNFQLLKTAVPKNALNWAMKRVAEDVDKREREPLALACEMARQELGLERQKPQTLRNYYAKGARLSKNPRKITFRSY